MIYSTLWLEVEKSFLAGENRTRPHSRRAPLGLIVHCSEGLPEPKPPFLAGARAVFLDRLLLLLYSIVNILFLRDPKYDYKYDYVYDYK